MTQVVNQKKTEIHLCNECAEEKHVNNPMTSLPQVFGSFIVSLLGGDLEKKTKRKVDVRCSHCGLTWDDFQSTGLLGCDICYHTFQEELQGILRRIHGSHKHIGNRPKSYRHVLTKAEVQMAKTELEKAIEDENFERAVELRDMIRDAQVELDISKRKE